LIYPGFDATIGLRVSRIQVEGNVDDDIRKLIIRSSDIGYAYALSDTGHFAEIIKVFSKYGLRIERW
jgi:hypothetical protein